MGTHWEHGQKTKKNKNPIPPGPLMSAFDFQNWLSPFFGLGYWAGTQSVGHSDTHEQWRHEHKSGVSKGQVRASKRASNCERGAGIPYC